MDNLSAMDLACIWFDNMAIEEDWRADYSRRTGKTRAEIVEEQRSHEIHDERAFVVGTFDGFTLKGIEIEDRYRYTVRTPWDMNEGLMDTEERNDVMAVMHLGAVTHEFSRLREESEPVTTVRDEKPRSRPVKATAKVNVAKNVTKVRRGPSRRNCVMPKRVPDAASIAKFGRKLASMSECPVCHE